MKNMTITTLDANHIDSLLAIESSSFKNPWGRLSFLDEISNQYSYSYVLTAPCNTGKQVVAYICLRRIIDEIHVLKIAVNHTHRRKGIAYRFFNECLSDVSHNGVRSVFLEVRPSNSAGLLLYRKLGFHVIGKRPNYYTDTGEDAVIMRKLI